MTYMDLQEERQAERTARLHFIAMDNKSLSLALRRMALSPRTYTSAERTALLNAAASRLWDV